ALAGQVHAAKGVVHARVQAASDEDEVRSEALEGGDHDAVQCGQVRRPTRSGGQRYVDIRARAGASADLLDRPAPGWKEIFLVQRNTQHAGVSPERGLGAVAVMHVPLDDRYALPTA